MNSWGMQAPTNHQKQPIALLFSKESLDNKLYWPATPMDRQAKNKNSHQKYTPTTQNHLHHLILNQGYQMYHKMKIRK